MATDRRDDTPASASARGGSVGEGSGGAESDAHAGVADARRTRAEMAILGNAQAPNDAVPNDAVPNDAVPTDSAPAEPSALSFMTDVLTLPSNLRVPNSLRSLLERMLHRSPTFRRQIDLIAKTRRVRIAVSYGGLRGDKLYHAISTVRKHQWGAMRVDTQLFVPADIVEIMAHELEHVCEQIEGVDLRALAGRKSAGVYDLNGHFETTRAIRAGQRVTREYQGTPADAPVATRLAY